MKTKVREKFKSCLKGEYGLSFSADGRARHQRVSLVSQKEDNILPLAQNLRSDEFMVSFKDDVGMSDCVVKQADLTCPSGGVAID